MNFSISSLALVVTLVTAYTLLMALFIAVYIIVYQNKIIKGKAAQKQKVLQPKIDSQIVDVKMRQAT